MGIVITENEFLDDGNRGLSDFELTTAFMNSHIMRNYKFKAAILRHTASAEYTHGVKD